MWLVCNLNSPTDFACPSTFPCTSYKTEGSIIWLGHQPSVYENQRWTNASTMTWSKPSARIWFRLHGFSKRGVYKSTHQPRLFTAEKMRIILFTFRSQVLFYCANKSFAPLLTPIQNKDSKHCIKLTSRWNSNQIIHHTAVLIVYHWKYSFLRKYALTPHITALTLTA